MVRARSYLPVLWVKISLHESFHVWVNTASVVCMLKFAFDGNSTDICGKTDRPPLSLVLRETPTNRKHFRDRVVILLPKYDTLKTGEPQNLVSREPLPN